jgi:hypothetical protein
MDGYEATKEYMMAQDPLIYLFICLIILKMDIVH